MHCGPKGCLWETSEPASPTEVGEGAGIWAQSSKGGARLSHRGHQPGTETQTPLRGKPSKELVHTLRSGSEGPRFKSACRPQLLTFRKSPTSHCPHVQKQTAGPAAQSWYVASLTLPSAGHCAGRGHAAPATGMLPAFAGFTCW